MRVLDLFCGLKGFSQAFADKGHEVETLDILQKFNPTYCVDVMELERLPGGFDVILASPPCNCFSMASVYRHWDNHKPKDEQTFQAIRLISHTFKLIFKAQPRFWVLENPMGMLRWVIGKPDYFITYCQYGERRMKPTDLWGVLPWFWTPKNCKPKADCHEHVPRSSNKGTQAMSGSEERAKIPYGLSLAICQAVEDFYRDIV